MAMRDTEELRAFSLRLGGSVQLYFRLSRRLTRVRLGLEPVPEWEVGTALLESFAMHTRGLTDFFFSHKSGRANKRVHDAWAFHYFDTSEEWMSKLGDPGPWLGLVYRRSTKQQRGTDRFGAQIAHLNYFEPPTSHYARGWPVMQLSHEMGRAVRTFVTEVADALVDPDFKLSTMREVPASSKIDGDPLPLATWTRPEMRMPSI